MYFKLKITEKRRQKEIVEMVPRKDIENNLLFQVIS